MKELEKILRLWKETEAVGDSAVLATVVKTQGSAYRLPGARLLLANSGQRAGSISGGCLEDDLIKKAWWLTEAGPTIKKYDTTPDGEIPSSGFGLGCSGIVHVILERLKPGASTVLNLIQDVRSERIPAVIGHVIHPTNAIRQRLVMDTHGELSHNLQAVELATSLERESRIALSEHISRTALLHESFEAFVEVVTPAIRLLVFGAGDDAVPITEFAKQLGWEVWVFDGRPHYARPEKFPAADKVHVRGPNSFSALPQIDPWAAAVLMSHSYTQDLENLRQLSTAPLSYVGMLGPHKRALQLLSDAGLDESQLHPALHSPMGLDIGADGPEQVALAVIAEIQAVLNGRHGGPLRERAGSIHSRDDASDAERFWLQAACLPQ